MVFRNRALLSIFCCMFSIIALQISCNEHDTKMKRVTAEPTQKILLLGASIGNAWNIESLPERMQNYSYEFEFIAKYDPNKTDILEQALNRKANKPDAIIIKQCAAYFRSDVEKYQPDHVQRYKHLADEWVKQCKTNDVVPILATVVPITEKMPFTIKIKRAIKKYILLKNIAPYYRPARLQGILDYNDWVKTYAQQNGLVVLDLESAVRVSEKNRYMAPELTTDGLHLNEKGYKRLDPILFETIKKAIKDTTVSES